MSDDLITTEEIAGEDGDELGLEALVVGMQAVEKTRCIIDFSAYFGKKLGTIEFHFASVDTPELFSVKKLMNRIKTQHKDWSDELLGITALLVMTCTDVVKRSNSKDVHISEREKKRLWIILPEFIHRIPIAACAEILLQWRTAFPHLANLNAAAQEAEKN